MNADGQKLMLYDNDHLGIIQKQLAPFERKPLEVSPDGDCMYHSILTQVHYDKNLYNAEMLRKQAAYFMLKRPKEFYLYALYQLEEDNKSYRSYCTNIYKGVTWGDSLVMAAISKMWNITISMLSLNYKKPLDLFHVSKNPDIIIIAHGGDDGSHQLCTHFSACETTNQLAPPVKPGSTLEHQYLIPRKTNIEKAKESVKKWVVRVARDEAKERYNECTPILQTNTEGNGSTGQHIWKD